MGINFLRAWIFSLKLYCTISSLALGLILLPLYKVQNMVYAINSTISTKPGSAPAKNNLAMDTSADTP